MTYELERLQFGSNFLNVPCNPDLLLSNPVVPISAKLVDCANSLWSLVFSFANGKFYLPGKIPPATSNSVIQSWYQPDGPGSGPHMLALTPFLLQSDGSPIGFINPNNFVDFSQPSPSATSISTDTIAAPSVVATVHLSLPEYIKIIISSSSSSQSILITTTITTAVFKEFFVYLGNPVVAPNSLTVQQGESCLALAVYQLEESRSSREIRVIFKPKIPEYEWPMLITDLISAILNNERGEIYEFLSPRVLASFDQETLQQALKAIDNQFEHLSKVKHLISSLSSEAPR